MKIIYSNSAKVSEHKLVDLEFNSYNKSYI